MPPVIGAIGAVASAVGSAMSATAISFGGMAITWGAIAKVALSVGVMALTRPKKPKVGDVSTGTQIQFKADTNAGVPLVLGRTGTGGNIVHVSTGGQETHNIGLTYVVVLSAGPIQEVENMIVNGYFTKVPSPGQDLIVDGPWANYMAYHIKYGNQPDDWNPLIGISDRDTTWDQSKVLSGLAYSMWFLHYDQQKYATGVPKPLWVVVGPKVYDPRRDSTYPGGNGPQIWWNEATWEFQGNRNPFLQAISWCIGRWQNGKLVLGAGIPLWALDVASFVEGANMCDNYTWFIGGVVTSADKKWDVLRSILQAGGGEPIKMGGKVGCIFSSPKTALATITTDDIKGKVTVTGTQSRRDRFNQVIPRYRSEPHNWEFVSASPVNLDTLITSDKALRSKEIEYSLVQDPSQASQLAMYDILNSRERGPISIPLSMEWADYKVGDALYIMAPELGLDQIHPVKVLIMKRDIDLEQGLVTLHCQTETDGKHPTALSTVGYAPPVNHLPSWDFSYLTPPLPYSYYAQGGTLVSETGQTTPILRIVGGADNPFAYQLIIRYKAAGTTNWSSLETRAGNINYDQVSVDITAVVENTIYEVDVAYRDKLGIITPYTTLSSVATGYYRLGGEGGALAAIPYKTNIVGYDSNWNTVTVYSEWMEVAVAGGDGGPYTYEWTQLDGTIMTCSAPTGFIVQFSAQVPSGLGIVAHWRCTVQDSSLPPNTAHTDIKVDLYNFTPGSIG